MEKLSELDTLETLRERFGSPIPLARWEGRGELRLSEAGFVVFLPFGEGRPCENWPTVGKPGLAKLERLARDVLDYEQRGPDRDPWVVLPALEPFVAEERRKREEAARAEERERERRRAEEEARERERTAIRESVEPRMRGWRRGTLRVAMEGGYREIPNALLAPEGLFGSLWGIHKEESADDCTLTHRPSGRAVAWGRERDLRALAVRLGDLPGIDWNVRDVSKEDRDKAAWLVLGYKRKRNPWILPKDVG